jgi:Skp family chaperone for outer membrane proteins
MNRRVVFLQRRISHLLALVVASILFSSGVARAAETSLTDARVTLEKWVETRQQISKAKGDWQADKETIQQTIHLFERELKNVADQMSKVSTNNAQVDKERAEAEGLQKASKDSLERAREFVAGFEGQITKLVPRLPGGDCAFIIPPTLRRAGPSTWC